LDLPAIIGGRDLSISTPLQRVRLSRAPKDVADQGVLIHVGMDGAEEPKNARCNTGASERRFNERKTSGMMNILSTENRWYLYQI
jgi:hypothetical protein